MKEREEEIAPYGRNADGEPLTPECDECGHLNKSDDKILQARGMTPCGFCGHFNEVLPGTVTYYWKTRRKGERWKVEGHDTFDELRESMESQMGGDYELKVMTVEECMNDEERRIRKSGGAGSEIYLVIADLNLLCEKVTDAHGMKDSRVMEYDGQYSGHKNETEALYYAACQHWPDSEHEIVFVTSDVVNGAPAAIILADSDRARRE